MFVYMMSIFNKCYREYLKSKSFFTVIFEPGEQHLQATISAGVITFVSVAPLSLSHSATFDQTNADVLLRSQATFKCPVVFLYPLST